MPDDDARYRNLAILPFLRLPLPLPSPSLGAQIGKAGSISARLGAYGMLLTKHTP